MHYNFDCLFFPRLGSELRLRACKKKKWIPSVRWTPRWWTIMAHSSSTTVSAYIYFYYFFHHFTDMMTHFKMTLRGYRCIRNTRSFNHTNYI